MQSLVEYLAVLRNIKTWKSGLKKEVKDELVRNARSGSTGKKEVAGKSEKMEEGKMSIDIKEAEELAREGQCKDCKGTHYGAHECYDEENCSGFKTEVKEIIEGEEKRLKEIEKRTITEMIKKKMAEDEMSYCQALAAVSKKLKKTIEDTAAESIKESSRRCYNCNASGGEDKIIICYCPEKVAYLGVQCMVVKDTDAIKCPHYQEGSNAEWKKKQEEKDCSAGPDCECEDCKKERDLWQAGKR